MLSKQSPALAKKQLGLAFDSKQEEFDEIMTLDNPAVRKKLAYFFISLRIESLLVSLPCFNSQVSGLWQMARTDHSTNIRGQKVP